MGNICQHRTGYCNGLWAGIQVSAKGKETSGHMMRQELGFRKSDQDSSVRLKEPPFSHGEWSVMSEQKANQLAWPPTTPTVSYSFTGTYCGCSRNRDGCWSCQANTTSMGPGLIRVGWGGPSVLIRCGRDRCPEDTHDHGGGALVQSVKGVWVSGRTFLGEVTFQPELEG